MSANSAGRRGPRAEVPVHSGRVRLEHRARRRAERGEVALRRAREPQPTHERVARDGVRAHDLGPAPARAQPVVLHLPEPVLGAREALREERVGLRLGARVRDAELVAQDLGHLLAERAPLAQRADLVGGEPELARAPHRCARRASGAGPAGPPAAAENSSGVATAWNSPWPPISGTDTIPFIAWTCGSATTSSWLRTGAHHRSARVELLGPLGERARGELAVEHGDQLVRVLAPASARRRSARPASHSG